MEGLALRDGDTEPLGVVLADGEALVVARGDAPGDRLAEGVDEGEREGEREADMDGVADREGLFELLAEREGVFELVGETAGAAFISVVWATKYSALMGTMTDHNRALLGALAAVGARHCASANTLFAPLLWVTPLQSDCSASPVLRPFVNQVPSRSLVLGPAQTSLNWVNVGQGYWHAPLNAPMTMPLIAEAPLFWEMRTRYSAPGV